MGRGNEMELVNGRPTDTQGRLDKEIRVYDFLDSLGVTYHFAPAVGDAELRAISEDRGISLLEVPLFDIPTFERLRNRTRFKRSLRRMILSSGVGKLRNLFRKVGS